MMRGSQLGVLEVESVRGCWEHLPKSMSRMLCWEGLPGLQSRHTETDLNTQSPKHRRIRLSCFRPWMKLSRVPSICCSCPGGALRNHPRNARILASLSISSASYLVTIYSQLASSAFVACPLGACLSAPPSLRLVASIQGGLSPPMAPTLTSARHTAEYPQVKSSIWMYSWCWQRLLRPWDRMYSCHLSSLLLFRSPLPSPMLPDTSVFVSTCVSCRSRQRTQPGRQGSSARQGLPMVSVCTCRQKASSLGSRMRLSRCGRRGWLRIRVRPPIWYLYGRYIPYPTCIYSRGTLWIYYQGDCGYTHV